jgi:hypothetical protein
MWAVTVFALCICSGINSLSNDDAMRLVEVRDLLAGQGWLDMTQYRLDPPARVGFYVCCAVAQAPLEAASRAMIPYLVVLLIGLLLVAFVPWFTLVLPHYFGFRG